MRRLLVVCGLVGCSGPDSKTVDASMTSIDRPPFMGGSPILGGCPVLPSDHIFNTPIDSMPVHASSAQFITTIGSTVRIHLDLGTQTSQQASDFYGIPYNLVDGTSFTWPQVNFFAADTANYSWNPEDESDCADAAKNVVSPCTTGTAYLPFKVGMLVEGGVNSTSSQTPDGDHHLLVIDTNTCKLWEGYHVYSPTPGTWNIFGSAVWDLGSNDLRTASWTSADAAGFPIVPLLLRADEASSGEIKHALRFTIQTSKIRGEYTWPATHESSSSTSASNPPYGQLFRLKASYQIPATFNTQSKAILTALKTYGMYIADGGSNMYISGEPSASWEDDTFSQVQSVAASEFEAVDLAPIKARAGWSATSAAVPAP